MNNQTLLAFIIIISLIFTSACGQKELSIEPKKLDWKQRVIKVNEDSSLLSGSSYLSVYSAVYLHSESDFKELSSTVSIRNINKQDTIYINKIEYFNTQGQLVKSFLENSIYIAPMETVEIVIELSDTEGGTGANFVFDWSIKPDSNEPLFEAVMISAVGNKGFGFVTHGKKIN
ncbi:DUF3124 domain-containing protein [Thalassotalea castellviae]|uniref:DUF3124 domain-containing protein n=1 Tax=Thalassotalea castellviae TaxID=3075612 RepID=A0ABU3A059_9GAMM|nr:DUF3124 domain-containing protein [Thalassotalea sp. W431]MDT0603330.1 DUF3124 domain-containing protein [Thalassotalea sp. W431]